MFLLSALAGIPAAAAADAITVGKVFAPFEATDAITGKPIKLTDFRGKLVLIDFWATWCGPCVHEIPNVQRAHLKYHDKGLEIISISLDRDINKCKQYVADKQMKWHHVIEGGQWRTRLARKYGIKSIPTMVLLDPNGVVVEPRLRARLHEAIELALKKTPPTLGSGSGAVAARQSDLEKADALLGEKKYVRAADAYEKVVKRYSGTEAAATAEKRLAEMRADEEIAAALSRAAGDREQVRCINWLGMARTLAESRNVAGARRYYERIMDECPETEEGQIAKKELALLLR